MSTTEPEPEEYPTVREPSFGEDYPTLHEPPEGIEPGETIGSAGFAEFTEAAGSTGSTGSAKSGDPARAVLGQIDPVSVGAGLVFFLIGGAYLLATGGHLTVNAGWTLSLLLLGLGLSGVVGAVIGRARRGRPRRR